MGNWPRHQERLLKDPDQAENKEELGVAGGRRELCACGGANKG